ncbi:MAG: VOC family protein [Chitinophagaceae bacterium]|nr:VOC family protein [Chitinophagaceae bacterium]
MKAVQFRIARPTNQLQEITRFYTDALGLKIIGSFSGHDGYDGVMLGLPESTYHLEFTQHSNMETLPPPTRENLLVFYFDNHEDYLAANRRIQDMNIGPVPPENPYWLGKSETYEDPDKWRIVLFDGLYIASV